ncbi:MAG: hypothetical protein PHU51_06285 [Candidatus Nanoarchaeia archaeon]|nr:hypothetical protein [Candidatus Nanoarchaeia archaeon]
MNSKTIKSNNGWSHTFSKRKDGTITIKQKNKKYDVERSVQIFDEDVLATFYEVVNNENKN